MTDIQQTQARAFRALHGSAAGFILPNAWDAGSAMVLAAEGFPAIATTSAGIAFSLGCQDYRVNAPHLAVTRADMFARMRQIVAAVRVPVNGDLEAGYGDAPETVAETIVMAIEAGLAGGNIEDVRPGATELYDEDCAARRIAAARRAIDTRGNAFVLNARTDVFQLLSAAEAVPAAIRRGNLYLQAGADCVFVPGVNDPGVIAKLARDIRGPLNIVIGLGDTGLNAHALLAAGVRRISLGGTIARAALGLVRQAAVELREKGTLGFAEGQMSGPELNRLFEEGRAIAR